MPARLATVSFDHLITIIVSFSCSDAARLAHRDAAFVQCQCPWQAASSCAIARHLDAVVLARQQLRRDEEEAEEGGGEGARDGSEGDGRKEAFLQHDDLLQDGAASGRCRGRDHEGKAEQLREPVAVVGCDRRVPSTPACLAWSVCLTS